MKLLPWTPIPTALLAGISFDNGLTFTAYSALVCSAWCLWVLWASGRPSDA